jgi:hypothetical protein
MPRASPTICGTFASAHLANPADSGATAGGHHAPPDWPAAPLGHLQFCVYEALIFATLWGVALVIYPIVSILVVARAKRR